MAEHADRIFGSHITLGGSMFSHQFYKVVHIVGIISVFMGLAVVTWNAYTGGPKKFPGRVIIMITHGVGLLIALTGGFGLMARLGMMQGGWPGWIHAKLTIWFTLGLLIAVPTRFQKLALPVWFLCIVLVGVAAFLANYKPF